MIRPFPQRRDRPARRGFTLFELLAVIAIMSVVTTLGTRTFFYMTSAWSHLKILTELDRIAEGAFESMREDFANVLSSELSGEAVFGITDENFSRSDDFDRVVDENDKIVIPVQTSLKGTPGLTGARVMYTLRRDGEEKKGRFRGAVLVRAVGNLRTNGNSPIFAAHDGNSVAVVDGERANVFRLRFEYAGADQDGEWQPEWYAAYSPNAVRVSMTLADPYQPHLQVSRKAVFTLRAR